MTESEPVLNIFCEADGSLSALLHPILRNQPSKHIHLFSSDLHSLISRFESSFDLLDAGGGLVFDESSSLLLIYRRGHWDFPKGKRELDETPKACAIREVQEETGVEILRLLSDGVVVRHCYSEGDRNILKFTTWFKMLAKGERPLLIPQTEEDIEQCIWCDLEEAKRKVLKGGYLSLQDLIPYLVS